MIETNPSQTICRAIAQKLKRTSIAVQVRRKQAGAKDLDLIPRGHGHGHGHGAQDRYRIAVLTLRSRDAYARIYINCKR